jgi:hypothetical protein
MHRSRIAVLILAATLSAACADQSSRPGATPLAGAPAGEPVILFASSNARAVTWSGREYLPANGIPQPAPSTTTGAAAAMPSPDGSSIVDEASPDRMWVRGTYVTGRPTPPSNLSFPTWADDSSRLCAISYNPDESSTLWVADPNGAWSKVAAVGRWVMNGGGPTVAACSWTTGRIAVAGFAGGNGEASEFWIFAWDGTVLIHRQTSPKAAHIYTFSRDASIRADFDESTGDTVVNDLTGNQLAVLKATFVEAFTWTGHYALAFDSTYNPGTRPNHGPYLVDWRSSRVVWRSSGNPLLDTGIYGPVALQPYGDGLALPLESIDCVGAARCNPLLQIVSPTGSWRLTGPAHLTWIALWP